VNTTDRTTHPRTDASRARVTGLVPPIVTPMQDGEIDHDSLTRLLDYLADHVAGYLVGGSLGEVASLTIEERGGLVRAVAEHAGGERSLAVSISDNCLDASRRLADVAGEAGAELVMVSCPNYFTNSRDMLIAYFAALAEFVPTDICLYDNPIVSHTELTVEDIAAIHQAVPRVSHIKVTDTAVDKVARLKETTDLVIFAGDDSVLWHQLTRGADGAMVALPMIYPALASSLWDALQAGDEVSAFDAYGEATRFLHVGLGASDYVAAVKTVLHTRGVIASPEVRLPLLPPSESRRHEFVSALE
jgi:4-hydroxy-tetrahydrodipicolinate synthase